MWGYSPKKRQGYKHQLRSQSSEDTQTVLLHEEFIFSLLEWGKKFLILRCRNIEMSVITYERAAFMGHEESTKHLSGKAVI